MDFSALFDGDTRIPKILVQTALNDRNSILTHFFNLACQSTPIFANSSSQSGEVNLSSADPTTTFHSRVTTSSSITEPFITPYLTEPAAMTSTKTKPVMTSSYTDLIPTEMSSSANSEQVITLPLTDPAFLTSSRSEPVMTSSYKEPLMTSSYTIPTPEKLPSLSNAKQTITSSLTDPPFMTSYREPTMTSSHIEPAPTELSLSSKAE